MNVKSKIFVAGHKGMVGSSIVRLLKQRNDVSVLCKDRAELNLLDKKTVNLFFKHERPDQIILAAAKVGGIAANSEKPSEFIFENLSIQNNVISSAHDNGIDKLLFLGSSCIYPKMAAQPIREESLMTGRLEESNEAYAIAKIAGIKMCESYYRQHKRDYRSVMPPNLYGPFDNFHPHNSHVIPGIMRRIHEAKKSNENEVIIWGSGNPVREFMFVDDLARACLFILDLEKEVYWKTVKPNCSHLNVGVGKGIKIRDLAMIMGNVIDYKGSFIFDNNYPDGTPEKVMDVSKLNDLGWEPKVSLRNGLEKLYDWAITNGILI